MYVCMYVWVEMDYDGTIVFIDIYIYQWIYVNFQGLC